MNFQQIVIIVATIILILRGSDMSNEKSSGGIGFVGMLTILFIGLKLGKVTDWSWWWVLSPIWISIGLAVVIAIIVVVVRGIDDY